jgi:hypothetical protein
MNTLFSTVRELVTLGDQFILKNGIANFHHKAGELLSSANCQQNFDPAEIVEACLKKRFDTKQNFASFEFSDLPLTIARGEHCFIDLYFWRRRATVIHNHHFSGAFQCLMGLNADREFSFIEERKLGNFHALGEIKLLDKKIIAPGEVQVIAPLAGYIHQNHHHADLTVNLCFRTPQATDGAISNYLYSGLACEKNPSLLERGDRLLKVLHLGLVDTDRLELDLDDALFFFLMTDGSGFQSAQFTKCKTRLARMIKEHAEVDIEQLLNDHNDELEQLFAETN